MVATNGFLKPQKLTLMDGRMVLVLDPSVMDELKFDINTLLDVSVENGRMLIARASEQPKIPTLAESLERVNAQYSRALKKLAE